MYLINLWGGPGSGKSTTAAFTFAYLKNLGVRAELVHEAAKRFIYKGAKQQLKNQLYVFAKQWSSIADLQANGCEVAISDSPLLQNVMYAGDTWYSDEINSLAAKLEQEFVVENIFILRTKKFDTFGRNQATLEEAALYDIKCRQLMHDLGKKFDFEDSGDPEGQVHIAHHVAKLIRPFELRNWAQGPFVAGTKVDPLSPGQFWNKPAQGVPNNGTKVVVSDRVILHIGDSQPDGHKE